LGRGKVRHDGLPAFAVFDGTMVFKIKQIAIYMARYTMMQSIGDTWYPDGTPPPSLPMIGSHQGRRITITIEG